MERMPDKGIPSMGSIGQPEKAPPSRDTPLEAPLAETSPLQQREYSIFVGIPLSTLSGAAARPFGAIIFACPFLESWGSTQKSFCGMSHTRGA